MDPGKKIFILGAGRQEAEDIRGQLKAREPAFKFEADHAADRALVRIVRWQPDLLIAGADLGNITGFELSDALKKHPACSGLRVILMINDESDLAGGAAARSAADLYVQRDAQLAENLHQGIRKLLQAPAAGPVLEERPVHRVLVVDDSRLMRRVISTILTGIGIDEVIEAADGMAGLQKLNDGGADMMMADYNMPRMNGLELVKQVRKNPRFAALPIVIVSAEVLDEIDLVLRAGANDFLQKPFTMQHLRDTVAAFASNVESDRKACPVVQSVSLVEKQEP